MTAPSIKKLTPILAVAAIEPCLSFWTDRFGLATVVTVPHGDRIGFAMLVGDGIEIMYQTHDSITADQGTPSTYGKTALYLEVEDLDAVIARLDPASIVIPRRTTFYGADEIYVAEPGGHIVGFAKQGAIAEAP